MRASEPDSPQLLEPNEQLSETGVVEGEVITCETNTCKNYLNLESLVKDIHTLLKAAQ